MPRPRGPLNPEKTRTHILVVATEAFASHGYHGSSLTSMADEVGITTAALLYHFNDKETLFNEVLRSTWQAVAAELAPVLASDCTGDELLAALVDALMSADTQRRSFFSQVNATLLGGSGVGSAAVHDTLLPLIGDVEAALRRTFASPVNAPVRETLLYIQLAHAAQDQLAKLVPGEAAAVSEIEPQLVLHLLHHALTPSPAPEV